MSDDQGRSSHTPDWTYTVRSDASWVNANGAIYNVTREHAPLIAAAPDLLRGLHKARDLLAQTDVEAYELMEIDVALAKAEGRNTGASDE